MEERALVFESSNAQACSDRALVLHSLNIPHEVLQQEDRYAVAVPLEFAERAKFEIWQYDQENRPRRVAKSAVIEHQNGFPGAFVYVVVVCLVAWLAGENAFNQDWLAAGRVDGERIRDGEWWRIVTALTLHAGVGHLLGNIGFGVLFGVLAGRLLGSGVAWLGILLAGGAGNALNTLLLDSTHRSIGASTAVFAALGLLAGFVWRARLMAQDRWPYRLGPIVGGLALLAFTGTGDANTDIGAHASGFVCGFASGMVLTFSTKNYSDARLQIICGIIALGLILVAWTAAFAGV